MSNFLNNGSMDDFFGGLGQDIVSLGASPSMQVAVGGLLAGLGGTTSSGYSQELAAARGSSTVKDLTPKTGLAAFFTFYNMDSNGVIIYDANGQPSYNMAKVIGIPALAVALFYLAKKYFFPTSRKKKKSRRF